MRTMRWPVRIFPVLVLVTACPLAVAAAPAEGRNLVVNGDFSAGLEGWRWSITRGGQGSGQVDRNVSRDGRPSLRITYASPHKGHRYGRLIQTVRDLRPLMRYRIEAWCRGRGVGHAWLGGGPGWRLRRVLPRGNYDWRKVSVDYATGPAETAFALMLVVETPTESLWIHQVAMKELGPVRPRIHSPEKGIPAAAGLYPCFPRSGKGPVPVVRFRKDKDFGADVRIVWDAGALTFDVDVLDPTYGPFQTGGNMWQSDCVQIGLDTRPDRPKPREGYTHSCFELGFAPRASGPPATHAWRAGAAKTFDGSAVRAKCERTGRGYRLHVSLPFSALGLPPGAPGRALGVNLIVNDGRNARGRRHAEWRRGTAVAKRPKLFARLVLLEPRRPQRLARLTVSRSRVDHDEHIGGRYFEYAAANLGESPLRLVVRDEAGREILHWLGPTLPKTPSGHTREVQFSFPAERLGREGPRRLRAVADARGQTPLTTEVSITKRYVRPVVEKLRRGHEAALAQIRKRLAAHPAMADDSYIQLGLAVARRFLRRVERGAAEHRHDPRWYLLQLEEIGQVLAQTGQYLREAEARGDRPVRVPRPAGGPAHVRGGVFYTDTKAGDAARMVRRPYYFAGYGHFGRIRQDLPVFAKLGVSLVQQEMGPKSLTRELRLGGHDRWLGQLFGQAAAGGIKIDFLLSPHYFPRWAVEKWPDMRGNFRYGGAAYNFDHPRAREIIGTYLKTIARRLGKEPALFSFCLSNEATFRHSGHDPYSRPHWAAYLRTRHKTISALNALYASNYAAFKDVPPPKRAVTQGSLGARRAYYDWCRFNQQHFAAWHRWMHETLKAHAPHIPTHAKIMCRIFSRSRIHNGVDPELFTEATDLAGNDCSASLTPRGPYAYNWRREELWFDLLHSFGGKPVFNSENHVIPDDSPPEHIPPAHVRARLWQGALHHLGATTMWVWEEPGHRSVRGSIFVRPANVYSAGRTMLDLNRLSEQVAAVSSAKADVAMLYSVPSIFWEADYEPAVYSTYIALTFLGRQITFISERQLAAGRLPEAKWIVLPKATHVTPPAVAALRRWVRGGGKVLAVGPGNLARDEYHRQRGQDKIPPLAAVLDLSGDDRALAARLREALGGGGTQHTALMDVDGRSFAWGVEYRVVPHRGRVLIPMIDHLRKPTTVRLALPGRAKDLLTGRDVNPAAIALQPMTPLLLVISAPADDR